MTMPRPTATRRRAIAAAAGLAALAVPGLLPRSARAQAWPSRPIRILVGFPPGGTADAYARAIGEHIAERVGQPVVVENRPGAAAMIALEAMAKSAPDGHTIALAPTSSYWQSRVVFRRIPFDPDRDIVPVTLLPAGPLVIGVTHNHPAKTMGEFVQWAKTHPASLGTFAPASTAHMLIDVINRNQGLTINAIHYKGEAPMWVDAASGQVNGGIGTFQSFSALYEKGALRPIAVNTATRSPKLPAVPTLVEQGLTDPILALEAWTSLVAPAKTPEPVLARIADLAVEFADTPRGLQFRERYGIARKPTTHREARRIAAEDAPRWIELARSLGITLD
jgi:tripartite-type tricarboxylate transporter receptor subunit TctC